MIKANQISYCSNVHPGELLEDVRLNISRYIELVRVQRGLKEMDLGLWLSAAAASELINKDALHQFKQDLTHANLKLTSMNGFPYGGFHQEVIKNKVYTPDWSEPERLTYSKNLAVILAQCLPENCDSGVISTLPLGYKAFWTKEKNALAIKNLAELNTYLISLKRETGKHIQLCIEMEPDCVLESTDELIKFFKQQSHENPKFKEHIGICYDVCHQAVMFENAYQALSRIQSEKITIGKIQLSNALEVNLDRKDTKLRDALDELCDKKYLHQVKKLTSEGKLSRKADLSEALIDEEFKGICRVHFHVPLHIKTLLHPQLTTTQSHLLDVFDFLKDNPLNRPYLEVETYSWQVMPAQLCPKNDNELITGIVNELSWVEAELTKRGLLAHE